MGLASSVGIISGIDYGNLVSQLVDLTSRPILLLQSKKADLQTVSAELSTLSVKLSALQTAASSLSSFSNFNTNTVSVTQTTSGVALLSATVDSTAIPGTSQVKVNQLAQTHSVASQGFVDDDTTAVASAAGTLKFKVGTAGAGLTSSREGGPGHVIQQSVGHDPQPLYPIKQTAILQWIHQPPAQLHQPVYYPK